MACARYEKLFYLYREGELTEKEERNLGRHLKSCAACRSEAKALASDMGRLAELQDTLSPAHSDSILQETLNRLSNLQGIMEQQNAPANRSKPVLWLRTGFAFALIVILLGFVTQEIWILNRLQALKKHQHGIPQESRISEALHFASSVLSKNGPVAEDYIVIDRAALDELLRSNYDLRLTNRLLLETLRNAIPDLEDNFVSNGIDRKELLLLLQNKNKIITALKKL